MSIATGPKLPKDSLVLSLDGANPRSTKGRRSVITWDSWTVGSGSATGYGQNGDGNTRLADTTPFGISDIVWQTLNNDATSDADGGWNTSSFAIDNTKTYRFSTWVKRKVLGNGSFYLGTYGYTAADSNVGVLNRSNGAVNTNPYFTSFGWSLAVDQWYLVVGHIWPAGSGTGSIHADTGIYTPAGAKVSSPQDFVWQPSNVRSVHRSYLYYSTDATTNQQWYQPRVDVCDGTEPTISELLNNAGNTWYDLSGNARNFTIYGLPSYNSSGYFTFANNQTTQYIMRYPYETPVTDITYSCWFRSNFSNATQVPFTYSVGGNNEMLFYINSNTQVAPHPLGVAQAVNTTDMANKWVNFAWSRKASTGENLFYRDGELIGQYTASAGVNIAANGHLIIGQEADLAGGGFDVNQNLDGDFARLDVYNTVLSAAEVKQSFNALRSRYAI